MGSEFVQSLYNLQSFDDFKKEQEKKYKEFRSIRLLPPPTLPESNDATATKYTTNPHLKDKAIRAAKAHTLWELEHPNLTQWGYLASTIPFTVAAAPFLAAAGEAVAGTTLASNIGTLATNVARAYPRVVTAGLAAMAAPMVYNGVKDVSKGKFTPITALDLSPLAPAVVKVPGVINNLRPLNLRNHWYVSKAPVGYDGIEDALERQFWGILSGKPANIDNPWWFNKNYEKQLQLYAYVPETVPAAERELYLQQFGEHALKARADAWRMHNLIPLKFNTFTPNPRHPGSWTDVEGIQHLKWIPPQVEGGLLLDFVNSVGGNIGVPQITRLGNGKPDRGYVIQKFGVSTTSDWFDLHPLSRKGDTLIDRLRYIYNNQTDRLSARLRMISDPLRFDFNKTKSWLNSHPQEEDFIMPDMFPRTGFRRIVGDKILQLSEKLNSINPPRFDFLKKLNDKLITTEVGDITGGKPFLVLYDIPFTTKYTFDSSETIPGFLSENIFPQAVFDWKRNKPYNIIYNK